MPNEGPGIGQDQEYGGFPSEGPGYTNQQGQFIQETEYLCLFDCVHVCFRSHVCFFYFYSYGGLPPQSNNDNTDE